MLTFIVLLSANKRSHPELLSETILKNIAEFTGKHLQWNRLWSLQQVTLLKKILLWLRKIPSFHLISWYGNFVERHSFRIVSGNLSKTIRKLYLSTKFPHQEFRWHYGILCSVSKYFPVSFAKLSRTRKLLLLYRNISKPMLNTVVVITSFLWFLESRKSTG